MLKRIQSAVLSALLFFSFALPLRVVAYTEGRVGAYSTFSAGGYHTTAIEADGTLWAWGWNKYGQIGDTTTADALAPVIVMVDGRAIGDLVSVSAGRWYTTAIRADGTLWAWGNNDSGQLGVRTGAAFNEYAAVKVMDDVASVSAGSQHTAIIKTDGSLWVWGYNEDGQVGNGSTSTQYAPVKIMEGAASVSVGGSHTVAVKTDGSLWAWGNNGLGQIGDGATTDRLTPVKIMDNVASVSAGFSNTAAIKTDGSLWVWGWNSHGQIGDGTITDRLTPVKIMDNVASVSIGQWHTAAIKTDGSLWTWGRNGSMELGDGTTTWRHSPVRVMTGVAAVSAGFEHTVALKADGTLWTWGFNGNGRLGDGTTTDSPAPIRVMDGIALPVKAALPAEKPSSWAQVDVEAAVTAGLVPSSLQSKYTQATTRAEFCALAVALYERVTGGAIAERTTFHDTDDVNVQKMGALGVVTGVGNGNFAPAQKLTREQAATMLSRLAGAIGKPLASGAATFSDNGSISSWAIEGVGQVQAAGIMSGVGSNTFSPKTDYTREQSIVTMLRLHDAVK